MAEHYDLIQYPAPAREQRERQTGRPARDMSGPARSMSGVTALEGVDQQGSQAGGTLDELACLAHLSAMGGCTRAAAKISALLE